MCGIDLEDFYAPWQHLLPLSNGTRRHVIRKQLLRKLPWMKQRVVQKEAKISQKSCTVDFSGHDPRRASLPLTTNSGGIVLNMAQWFPRLSDMRGRE